MNRGEGGFSQKVSFDDKGGRGRPDLPKKKDIINEQICNLKKKSLFGKVKSTLSCGSIGNNLNRVNKALFSRM